MMKRGKNILSSGFTAAVDSVLKKREATRTINQPRRKPPEQKGANNENHTSWFIQVNKKNVHRLARTPVRDWTDSNAMRVCPSGARCVLVYEDTDAGGSRPPAAATTSTISSRATSTIAPMRCSAPI